MRGEQRKLWVWLLGAVVAAGLARSATACPLCNVVSTAMADEIKGADVAVLARLVKVPTPEEIKAAPIDRPAKTVFEVRQYLKGRDRVSGAKTIELALFRQQGKQELYLLFGVEPPDVYWSTPVGLSEEGARYVAALPTLPEEPEERLKFFLPFLRSADTVLATDAYTEFAKAPYTAVRTMGQVVGRQSLLEWIADSKTSIDHRRLFLLMLGASGERSDAKTIEQMMLSPDPELRKALDPLIACYLKLIGADGLKFVVDRFVNRPEAEFRDKFALVQALRFHGQEESVVPREKIIDVFRIMIDDAKTAEIVVDDLARWQDWSVLDKLVALFKKSDTDETSWVRVPIVRYLLACPEPRAARILAELETIDPHAVKHGKLNFVAPKPTATVTPKAGAEPTSPPQRDENTVKLPIVPEVEGASSPASGAEPDAASRATESGSVSLFTIGLGVVGGLLFLGLLVVVLRGQ